MMRRIVRLGSALALMAGILSVMVPGAAEAASARDSSSSRSLAATAAQAVPVPSVPRAAGTVHGCPLGYVCVYPQNKGLNGDHPSLFFYTYGAHNLSNQFGNHYIINNQTGGAWQWECYGYNGTRGWFTGSNPSSVPLQVNLTPINSIVLTRGYPASVCGMRTP